MPKIMMQPQDLYIFDGLTPQEISFFLLMAETRTYKKGNTIIEEWATSDDRAYCLQSGNVDVFRSGEKIATLDAGDIFGELALITSEPRAATVKAVGDVEVLVFYKDDFLTLYRKSDRYEQIKQKILARIRENFYEDTK